MCEKIKVRRRGGESSDSLPNYCHPFLAGLGPSPRTGLPYITFPLHCHSFAVMSTPHVIASSSGHPSQSGNSSSSGIVGGHYKVGKKIGEGSFGVVFEGMPIHPSERHTIPLSAPHGGRK